MNILEYDFHRCQNAKTMYLGSCLITIMHRRLRDVQPKILHGLQVQGWHAFQGMAFARIGEWTRVYQAGL